MKTDKCQTALIPFFLINHLTAESVEEIDLH